MRSTPSAIRGYATAAGRRLETLRIPARDAQLPTIVLLHEALGSVSHWKDFPQRLAARSGAGVFVYSRYGHGASDRLEEKRRPSYLHEEAEAALPELLEREQIDRPVLLGHSDGASIAILYAAKYPDSPRSLILEAPHVFVEDVTVRGVAAAGIAYRTTGLPEKLGRYHAHAAEMFWGWNDIWLDPVFRGWNIESSLDAILCPVLVMQGEDDEYGTVKQVEAIRARVPSCEAVMLADCRHTPHRDRPEEVVSRILDFLAIRL